MSKNLSKWKLNFGLPSRFELGMVVLAFIFFIVMDAYQNFYQPSFPNGASDLYGSPYFGLTAVTGFFLFFVLYNLVLFVVFSRSLRKPSTSYRFDLVAGIVAFVGMLFILNAGIGAMYYSAEQGMPWFLGISQITIYHAGVLSELLAMMYFIVTD